MKKLLSILLALTLALSLSTAALADSTVTGVTENNTASYDVYATAKVNNGGYADIVYSVNIAWSVDNAEIDVDNSGLYVWNPATLKYEKSGSAADEVNEPVDVTITMTNSSNAGVNYMITYADNSSDGLTTSEAPKSNSVAAGTLRTADTIADMAWKSDKEQYDYAIDVSKQVGTGTQQTVTYEGTVTVTAIANPTSIANGADLQLGTYTVTLAKAAAEYINIKQVLATVNGGFPATASSSYKMPENAWQGSIAGTSVCRYNGDSYDQLMLEGPVLFDVTAPVTKLDNGDYEAVFERTVVGAQGYSQKLTYTITFKMDDGALTAIHVVVPEIDYDNTYSPAAN